MVCLVGKSSNSRTRGAHSGDANREPRVNFNDRPNRGRPIDPLEEVTTHSAMPAGTTGRGVQRIPEEILLAAGRSRVNDLCEKRMRLEEMISQSGTTRINKDLSPAIRTEVERIVTIKQHMQRHWQQCLNL